MSISKINGIPLTRRVNPVGLIKGIEYRTIDSVEIKATLDKAVEDAHLNVTERLALNKEFFPNGGGFELFPKNVSVPEYTFYYKKGSASLDEFSREAEAIKIPQRISIISQTIRRSNKNCFEKNLENAINKLKSVIKKF